MKYSELRGLFHTILNRNDCSDHDADLYIGLGIRRIERILKIPMQSNFLGVLVGDDWPGFVNIPTDYLRIDEISVDGSPVPRVTKSQSESVRGWYVESGRFYFSPDVKENQEVHIHYFGEGHKDTSDDSRSIYTTALSDATVYSALAFAGDTFEDTRMQRWENKAVQLVGEIQGMADEDAMAGLHVTPYGGGIA